MSLIEHTVSQASIPTRYLEDLKQLISQYPRRTASAYLARTKKVIKWLRKDQRLALQ